MSVVVFPELAFYSFPLSAAARHQLSNIYKTRTAWCLADVIRRNAINWDKGVYVPLSPTIYLVRKLADVSKNIAPNAEGDRSLPFPATYFTNGLVIPADYETPSFDPESAAAPKLRATNIGFLIITHEFDCKTTEQFEEILSWTRGQGGDLSKSVLSQWDRELSTVKEYR